MYRVKTGGRNKTSVREIETRLTDSLEYDAGNIVDILNSANGCVIILTNDLNLLKEYGIDPNDIELV